MRLVSATHRDLRQRIEEGSFREDLYYRFKVVTIEIPPLRERTADIPLLVDHFITEYSRVHSKRIEGISRDALRAILRYPWPGNVRVLKNAVENMVVTSLNPVIEVEDLNQEIRRDLPPGTERSSEDRPSAVGLQVGTTIQEMERELIKITLDAVNGNRRDAAKMLGIGERTLYRKITEYGLRDAPAK